VPLQAWIDDSGGLGQGPVFVFAGFIGAAEAWDGFSERWRARLNEHPGVRYFKMQEAHKLTGQFSGWTRAKAAAKVERLTDALTDPSEVVQ
jgi:hypothetical protein